MMRDPLTFQELAEKYGIKDYPAFRRHTDGQINRVRGRQIWYGETGIGYKYAALLSEILEIPYEEVRCVVPLKLKKDHANSDGGAAD